VKLWKDIPGLLLVRLLGLGLQLVVQLVVGRLAGPAGLGLLQLFTSWTCVAGEAAALGRPVHAMRTLAVSREGAGRSGLDAYLSRQVRAIAAPWFVMLIIALPVLLQLKRGRFILLVMLAAGGFALLRLFSESLKALARPAVSVLVETCVPAIAVLLLCAALWWTGDAVRGEQLILSMAAGILLAVLMLAAVLARRLADSRDQGDAVADARWSELLPLWGGGLLSILLMQLPFLFLPFYADVESTGQFALAYKLVNLVSVVLLLLASLYGPRFASAWRDAPAELSRLLWQSQYSSFALFAAPALLLLLGGRWLLGLFGAEFVEAQPLLLVLLCGQLINAVTGLPGLLLNMAGRGRDEFHSLLLSLALASAGCLWLGPAHGAMGIAVAYSGALAFKNLLSWSLARRVLRAVPGDAEELIS
jgi:O-antigen/teichoic acid export membrane protein